MQGLLGLMKSVSSAIVPEVGSRTMAFHIIGHLKAISRKGLKLEFQDLREDWGQTEVLITSSFQYIN